MVLVQRFETGRSNHIELGKDFEIINCTSPAFDKIFKAEFPEPKMGEGCIKFVVYRDGDKYVHEPIFKTFPQWLYSNNGELFLTLINGEEVAA